MGCMGYPPGPGSDWAPPDATTRPIPRTSAPAPYLPAPYVPARPSPRPGSPRRWTRRLRTWLRSPWARRTLLGLLVIALLLGILGIHRLSDFGGAISNQGPFTSQTGYMTGNTRANLLVLGYGGAGHDGAYLTDSMMVLSVIPGSGATTMISVPRDLWVQVPPDSGNYAKINTAYNDGLANGYGALPAGKLAAGAEAARKVSDVLGFPVQYWLAIDFSGFRTLVDSLGGVDMTVPTAFTAQYPANDDAQIDASWKTIHFDAGPQHMNGERAIEYARARYVTDPLSEASDFARSARQQLLIRAILGRARQVSAWPGLNGALDALQRAIYTNFSLADLALFAQRTDFNGAAKVVLSNQNVLTGEQASDGEDILVPNNGDWNAIQHYVAANLKP